MIDEIRISMPIELLTHHVKSTRPERERGVFDEWEEWGLEPTMKAIQKNVIPRLITKVYKNGKSVYPFLTKNPKQKHEFTKRFLECYKVFLTGNYVEIPDYDPATGRHNKGHLCCACPTWESLCSNLVIVVADET